VAAHQTMVQLSHCNISHRKCDNFHNSHQNNFCRHFSIKWRNTSFYYQTRWNSALGQVSLKQQCRQHLKYTVCNC